MESAQRVPAIRFRLGGIPVEVQVSFFLIIGLFGWGLSATHWLIWLGVAFVSILVHELGHAVAARSFGSPASISLYGFGGLTSYRQTTVHRSLVITLAGPFSGLALGAIVYVVSEAAGPVHGDVRAAVIIALWINVVWSLVNLLPILPLDGGNVLRDIIHIVSGVDREALVRRVSIAVAVAGGVWAYTAGYPFSALFALFFIGTNLQGLRAVTARQGERRLVDAASRLESAGDVRGATDVADSILRDRPDAALEVQAAIVEAWACLQARDVSGAQAALAGLPEGTPVPLHLRGALALASGATDQGLALVVDGFVQHGRFSPRGLAVQVHAAGVTDDLVERLLLLDPLDQEGAMQLQAGLEHAGLHREAVDLGARLRERFGREQPGLG
ncbi:MAG: site-2 protease family protein [Actinomycetota bacterium]|nr:site-2 protease family protein [Actinomycetota bacterium]